jgi:hypothetical protein
LDAVAGSSSGAKNPVGQTGRDAKPDAGAQAAGNDELLLSVRLVTLDVIADRLEGIRRVIVGPKTVVTPAARDALRQRKIELSRNLHAQNPSAARLKNIVVAESVKMEAKTLADALRAESIEVQCSSTDCILAAVDQLAVELAKGDSLGLLLTPHTAAALCLANRLPGVRAVPGNEAQRLEAELCSVGANLLVVDPQKLAFFKLFRMTGEFFRGGIRPCPDAFKKRLM